jgi:hypothetical protein
MSSPVKSKSGGKAADAAADDDDAMGLRLRHAYFYLVRRPWASAPLPPPLPWADVYLWTKQSTALHYKPSQPPRRRHHR